MLLADLQEFEIEVLEILRDEGPITYKKQGSRSLAHLFGYDSGMQDQLCRALRQLEQKGFLLKHDDGRFIRFHCP